MKVLSFLIPMMLSIVFFTSCSKEKLEEVESTNEAFVVAVSSLSTARIGDVFNEDETLWLMEILVQDSNNTPLVNVTCTLTSTNSTPIYSETSIQNGVCSFPAVEPGQYTITIDDNGNPLTVLSVVQNGQNATVTVQYSK